MADVNNWRYGSTNPVKAQIHTVQAVSRGDLIALSTGYVTLASQESDALKASAQTDFAAHFLGVSGQRKKANEAQPGHGGGQANRIRVATTGVFEFDTFASTLEVGDLVGPAYSATTSTIEDQKVELVTNVAQAIGRVQEKKSDAASTTVLVRIFSKVMLGGPQA